jgi:hypothetical protein
LIPEGNWAGGGKIIDYGQVKGLVADERTLINRLGSVRVWTSLVRSRPHRTLRRMCRWPRRSATGERGYTTPRPGAGVDVLPGGRGWREAVEAHPETERHLAIHEGHLVKANPRDEPYVADLIPLASAAALTGTVEQASVRVGELAALGVTELVYQPAGSDIERELRAFASASGLNG